MVKILHVIHGLNLGGAENFIFNLLSAIDNSAFKFDFAIQEPEIKHTRFKELIIEKGGQIFIIRDFTRNPFAQIGDLKAILKNGYDFVHIHMNAFINPLPAIVASSFDCKVIIHSHSTQNGRGGFVGKFVHRINKAMFLKNKFIRLACGQDAGKWMFGNKDFKVINNAVDTSKYAFNVSSREKIRNSYGITDEYVVGQVGRLLAIKNQVFSLNMFSSLKKTYPDLRVKLMIVGDGPDKEMLKALSDNLGIGRDVIFTGAVHNVNEYYSAFDSFIMPSLFEGLTLAAIEAQTAGLKSIISSTVPKEVDITNCVDFLPLSQSDKWVKRIYENSLLGDRPGIAKRVVGSKFDLSVMVEDMSRVYDAD